MNYKQIQKSGAQSSGSPKNSKFFSNLLFLVYGLVGLLAVVNLVGTNALATQGIMLDSVLKQTGQINKENQILAVEIGKINNLNYIESTATKLGFRRVKSNMVISPVEAVAAVIR